MWLEGVGLHQTLNWSARLLALAMALQTIELLQLRDKLSDRGIWRHALLARDYDTLSAPLRWVFTQLLPYRRFLWVLVAQLACACVVMICGCLGAVPLLLVGALLTCVRFRGAFNGGSDCMTLVIALALSAAAFLPQAPLFQSGCLGYIAVQTTLSYAIAGLSKLKEPQWRDGRALQELLHCREYALPGWLGSLLQGQRRLKALSLLVIAFECSFPLAWFDRRIAIALIVMGALFHLGNAAVLGLNRFLFAWLASYPALLYFSELSRI